MEVELLPGQQQQLPAHHKWQRQQAVTALQGPDVATDVQMAEFISSSNTLGWQLMACLLHPASSGPVAAGAGTDAAAAAAGAAAGEGIAPIAAAGPADDEGDSDALVSDIAASRSSQEGLEDGETAALVPGDGHNPEEDGGVGSAGAGAPHARLSHSQEPKAAGADAAGGDSSSSQEMVPVRRHKRRLRPTRRNSSAGNSSSEEMWDAEGSPGIPTAATAAGYAVSSDSDWDADFDQTACRPGKRARRGVGAAAVLSDSPVDDSCDSDTELDKDHQQDTAAPPAAAAAAEDAQQGVDAAAEVTAAAQKLLKQVVMQFRLNPAQAAVAAHVADWLPQLMQDVQKRQQQGGRKGPGRIRTPALLASKTSTAAGGQGSSKQQGPGSSSSRSSARPPVCLIHGPFGSGKSSLLVAVIHLLTGLFTLEVWVCSQCFCLSQLLLLLLLLLHHPMTLC